MDPTILLCLGLIHIAGMAMMIVICWCSHAMKERQKIHFTVVFSAILLLIAIQTVILFLDGWPHVCRPLRGALYFLNFLMVPLIPLLFAEAMSGFQQSRIFFMIYGIYGLFLLLSSSSGLIYDLSGETSHRYGQGYWVFLIVHFVFACHLIRETARFWTVYRNSSRVIAGCLLVFLLTGNCLQVVLSTAFLSWVCVCFSSVLFFIYCADIWTQVDALTGLLNHSTYLRKIEDLSPGTYLILFDVDRFKAINDTFGHLVGDQCLIHIAKIIRTVYSPFGSCYRIGGDEFAAIVSRKNFNPQEKEVKFRHFISQLCQAVIGMTTVSVGCARYEAGMTVQELINQADQNMYRQKKAQSDSLSIDH